MAGRWGESYSGDKTMSKNPNNPNLKIYIHARGSGINKQYCWVQYVCGCHTDVGGASVPYIKIASGSFYADAEIHLGGYGSPLAQKYAPCPTRQFTQSPPRRAENVVADQI